MGRKGRKRNRRFLVEEFEFKIEDLDDLINKFDLDMYLQLMERAKKRKPRYIV